MDSGLGATQVGYGDLGHFRFRSQVNLRSVAPPRNDHFRVSPSSRESRDSGAIHLAGHWIPACAGMSGGWGEPRDKQKQPFTRTLTGGPGSRPGHPSLPSRGGLPPKAAGWGFCTHWNMPPPARSIPRKPREHHFRDEKKSVPAFLPPCVGGTGRAVYRKRRVFGLPPTPTLPPKGGRERAEFAAISALQLGNVQGSPKGTGSSKMARASPTLMASATRLTGPALAQKRPMGPKKPPRPPIPPLKGRAAAEGGGVGLARPLEHDPTRLAPLATLPSRGGMERAAKPGS